MQTPKNLAEFNQLIASDKLVVVDYFATWCGPCKIIAPKLDNLAKEYTDVIFAKVDVDEVADVAADQGIRAMPTIKFYRKGALLGEVIGANLTQIVETLKKHA
ncbi:cytosolic thioredoxin Trx1 [Dichotomocladium elegans]|nr:cytosolic thioredoxin Trx1 [Dichotomocladium elegans]